jgi:hypothetical protein
MTMHPRTLVVITMLAAAQLACSKDPDTDDVERDQSESLEGTDEDENGVRDDIDAYIESAAPDSERTRAAMRQVAKELQAHIPARHDKERAMEVAVRTDRGIECLLGVEPQRGFDMLTELEARTYNTKQRARAYAKANGHFGGEYFRGTQLSKFLNSCAFDVEALEN